MKYATVLGLLVGCASVDDPPALTGPTLEVSVDTAIHVTAQDYKIDFSGTDVKLPAHLTVSETDLLGTEACSENLIGVAVAPAVAIAAGKPQGSDTVTSEAVAVLTGPAVAKIHVTFEVAYSCPNKQTAAGAIDFTMFPGGRIVREDLAITPSTDQLTKVGNCGCQQESNPTNFHDLVFSSYWAFKKTGATQVLANGNLVNPNTDDQFAACTMYPGFTIGVSWNQQGDVGTRYSPHETASHVLAWSNSSDPSMLAPTPQSMTSAIQIDNKPPMAQSDCAAVLALLDDVPLQIGNTMLGSTDHDGIYRDLTPHTSAFDIKSNAATVPSDFAISVDLGGADHAVIRPEGIVATAQREDGNRFLIVFRDGMNPGDVITIEPRR
jgi:hypothetical protein